MKGAARTPALFGLKQWIVLLAAVALAELKVRYLRWRAR